MSIVTPAQLLAEIEDTIRTYSSITTAPDLVSWVARATMLLKRWDPARSITFNIKAQEAIRQDTILSTASNALLMVLHEARHDLRLGELGPLSVTHDRGAVLDYFEEVRKVIVTARRELFFVDPYLDASFVSRFLPSVLPATRVRLLGKKHMATLAPAVELAAQQFGMSVSLRAAPSLHDRFLFVDGSRCFQSGASFKDGARLAPTTFTELIDAGESVLDLYEQIWASALPHPSPPA